MKTLGVGQDGGDDLQIGCLLLLIGVDWRIKFSSEPGLKGRWEGAWEYTLLQSLEIAAEIVIIIVTAMYIVGLKMHGM